jgi:hypothetical protein
MSLKSDELRDKLVSIGLETYLPLLLSKGYQNWESVLKLSEEDFESLQIKRGHRRRLQRQIATDRGHSINHPLANAENSGRSLAPTDRWDTGGQEQAAGRRRSRQVSAQSLTTLDSSNSGSSTNMNEWPSVEEAHVVSQMWQAMDLGEGDVRVNETSSRNLQTQGNDYNSNEINQRSDTDFHSELESNVEDESSQIRHEEISEQGMWEFVNF